MLSAIPTPFQLIDFFHSDRPEYATRDSILKFLVSEYQRGGPCERLGTLFLVLFTPAIVRIYSISRKKLLYLDPGDILSQTCLYLLETIKAIHLKPFDTRVASRIVGAVKNKMRAWTKQQIKETTTKEDFLEEEIYDPLPVIEDGNHPVDIDQANRFLEIFVKAGIITETDKLIILGSSIANRSLKQFAGDPRVYQRVKKRRQRAIAAMKLYLQRKRRLRALKEGLGEDEISLAEIVRDLLQ